MSPYHRTFQTSTPALWGLMAGNVGVFSLWQAGNKKDMTKNFAVSSESLRSGRYHTVLTSAFSHQQFEHLLSNLFGLFMFGHEINLTYGNRFLLGLYGIGGIIGSLSHVGYHHYKLNNSKHSYGQWGKYMDWGYRDGPPALGASGAVNSIVFFSAVMNPMRTVYLNFLLPIPVIALAGLYVLNDYSGLSNNPRIGHACHLGGAGVGVIAAIGLKFPPTQRLIRRML